MDRVHASNGKASETTLKCIHCPHTTPSTSIEAMREHVKTHLNYNHFVCSYCPYTAMKSKYVKAHLHERHPGQNVSIRKYKNIEVEASLEMHYTTHKKEVEHSSLVCADKSPVQMADDGSKTKELQLDINALGIAPDKR